MEENWGCLERLEHAWSIGVLGYCGVDPIDIRFLRDSAFDTGRHEGHLDTAYEAGSRFCPEVSVGLAAGLNAGASRTSTRRARMIGKE